MKIFKLIIILGASFWIVGGFIISYNITFKLEKDQDLKKPQVEKLDNYKEE